MNTRELIDYYANLLILQYVGKARAYATIQTLVNPVVMPQVSTQEITFVLAPTSGTFVLSYDGVSSAAINWNDSAGTIQTKLQAIAGLESVTVSGAISDLSLIITFVDVPPPALILVLESNTLLNSGDSVGVTITETDETLPIAVQNSFNVTGTDYARGVQLDVIGKYAGVTRTGSGFTAPITLDDADFISLIQVAIIKNSAGSSLATIQELLHQFFPDQILVFDYQNMQMSYLVSTSVGSPELIQLFITEGLLPEPMGVGISLIIYAPVINMFFGFRTYSAPAFNSTPFNDYADYQTDWPWLSYANAISV